MNLKMKSQFTKTMLGVILSFSIIAPSSMWLSSSTLYAASSEATSQQSTIAQNIIATGKKYMGVPYQYGADEGQTNTFDCSSFTQYVYKKNGITLPRSSEEQSHTGTYVPKSELKPGDLVFFYSPIHHVAIYIGDGKILHTYGDEGVTITNMNEGWWKDHYAAARRVILTKQTQPAANDEANKAPNTANEKSGSTLERQRNQTSQQPDWTPSDYNLPSDFQTWFMNYFG